MIRKVEAGFAGVRERIAGRHAELKRQLEQSRQRQSAFLQCDKDRLASLAEAIEEQGYGFHSDSDPISSVLSCNGS